VKNKFVSNKPKVVHGQELLAGLDKLAQTIIDEMNGDIITDPEGAGTGEKLAALKTVAAYVAMKNKVDTPLAEGSAFDEYRNKGKQTTAAERAGDTIGGAGCSSNGVPPYANATGNISVVSFGRTSAPEED